MAINPKMTMHQFVKEYWPEHFRATPVERAVNILHRIMSVHWVSEETIRGAIRDVLDAHWRATLGETFPDRGRCADPNCPCWMHEVIEMFSGETKEAK